MEYRIWQVILIFKWKLVSLSELFLAKLCLSVHVLVIFHNYIKTPLLEPSFLYSFLKFKVSKSVKTVEIKSSQQLSTLLDISRQKVNKNPNAMSQSIWTHCDMARFGNNPPSWWCTTMSGIAAARLGVRLKNLALITSWHITYLIRVVRLHNQKLIERKQKPLCEIFLQQPKHSPSHYLAMAQCTLHRILMRNVYKVHKAEQKLT